jgi:hypothetical protein
MNTITKNQTYYILIAFIIFLAIKKSLDIIIDLKYPSYIPPPNGTWKHAVSVRDLLSILTFFLCIAILLIIHNNSNYYINVIITSYLLYEVAYFLLDKGFIWNIINKNEKSEKIVKFFDVHLNSFVNLLLGLYCFYAIVYIFK